MFGNCVWAELSSTHPINNNILNFTRLFNLPTFKAHLTLEYNLKEPFIRENYILDDLVIDGCPYLTCKDNFHAIQQDYFMKNNPSKKLHISLAYKNGKEIHNLIIINHPEDAERLANKHIKKMGNLKPFVLDSIISTTDVKHWKEQRRDFQTAFSVKDKIEKVLPISCDRAFYCSEKLWELSGKGEKEVNISDFLNETHAQLQLAALVFE